MSKIEPLSDPTPEEIQRVDEYHRRQSAVTAQDMQDKAEGARVENRNRIRDLLTGKTIVGVSVVDPADYLVEEDNAVVWGVLALVLRDGTVVSIDTHDGEIGLSWKSVAS